MSWLLKKTENQALRSKSNMEKYTEEFATKMREIYKAVIRRVVDTGKTEKSDILFIALYKQNFEQNTKF